MAKTGAPAISVGGQAVLEGVMMRGARVTAVAVRREDGAIVLEATPYTPPAQKHKWMGWPLVRGVVNFALMLSLGMKTLSRSAELYAGAPEEPSRFEKAVAKATGKAAKDVAPMLGMVLGVGLAVVLFMLLPAWLMSLMGRWVEGKFWLALAEGGLRIGIFLAYLLLMGAAKDVRRVFGYHGAEHQSVAAFEHGEALTPENARKYTRLHPRCGTSFLLVVMVVSILVFALLGVGGAQNILLRTVSRLALLPVVVAVSYEVLRVLGKYENGFIRALRAPGMALQHLTTRAPDDAMLEVAIVALRAALELPQEPLYGLMVEETNGGGAEPSAEEPREAHAP